MRRRRHARPALVPLVLVFACSPPPAPPGLASPAASPAGSFTCGALQGGGARGPVSGPVNVVRVTTSTASGYDRFELELDGPVPGYQLTRQLNAIFTQDASGFQIRVEGTAGVLVRMEIADSHTRYTGPRDLTPRYQLLREARLVSDFEGVVLWGLGLDRPACLRVQTLSTPTRLVIDMSPAT